MLAALLPATQALSAGLDCALAATATETAICADQALRRLDSRLSSVYGKLSRAQAARRDALRQAQLSWLAGRDRCGASASCIQQQYQARLEVTRAQLRDAVAYQPDHVDRQALEDLRQAVEAMRKSDAEFPLEKVLRGLAIDTGMTHFSNGHEATESDGNAHFPRTRPAGVTGDEWRALLASNIDGGGENGSANYALVDLDGDGRRDLVINSYTGGTGLFSYTSALRRDGGKFIGAYRGGVDDLGQDPADDPEDAAGTSYLFSTSGRGANQAGYWIRLRGRVYAAYQVGYYGVDNLYLLRPLTVIGKVPKLALHYRYRLAVPKIQSDEEKGTKTTLAPALHAALTQALALVSKEQSNDVGSQEKPLCPFPSPDSVDADELGTYYGYGTGHYTYEIVGDMPVWLGRQCHIGRLVDWFGAYSGKGKLYAQLWVRKPGGSEEPSTQTYTVKGVRSAIGVKTSIAKVEGDNGA
ncbi:lysozyme inhibitor LprI family protein [Janthinobacterium sp. hw3]|uniref:Lysozyme inhibitor LprI family protein n=1 Tax=Janthinobacterium fluminis TaxID=2987524 RepID=A0ABT5K3M0_9BURK|nr:lysozyme inhibitor LprI family protein [Janthinobacterium fluminis]